MFNVRTRGGVYVKFNTEKIKEVLDKINGDVSELSEDEIDVLEKVEEKDSK